MIWWREDKGISEFRVMFFVCISKAINSANFPLEMFEQTHVVG
jgi:hypothetical protein